MSRIIKFRAWDGVNKDMFIPNFIVQYQSKFYEEDDSSYKTLLDGIARVGAVSFDDPTEKGYLDDGLHTRDQDWVLMQFTGLKDKNGREIYEGDLIAHPMGIGEVCFSQGRFFVTGFYYPSYDDPSDAFGEGLDILEVVGNIWQNPELLERGKNTI